MKKLFFVSVMSLFFCFAYSQEPEILTNKSGIVILPEKGDFSLSIDAVPFLNLLNNKGNGPGYNYIYGIPSVYLKYMITKKSAFMCSLIYKSHNTGTEANTTAPQVSGEGLNEKEFGFRFGFERRHGEHRLQVPYGVEIGFSRFQNEFYDNQNPSQNYGEEGIKFFSSLFIGTEYFFLPKMSLGGRFSYGYSYSKKDHNGSGSDNSYKEHANSFGYDNLGGAILLSFYF